MSTPIHSLVTGTFVSDGTPHNITIPAGYNVIELFNTSDLASGSTTNVMLASGTDTMAAGGAYYSIGNGGSSVLSPKYTSTNGFTFVADSATLASNAAIALNGTEINQANPAVADTGTTTGLVSGSTIVRLYGTTGMLQVSGMDFTVGTVIASTSFQLKYLDTTQTGFGADATAGNYILVNARGRYYPKHRSITKIASSGTSTVITMSVTHGMVVGQEVRLVVPTAWGMNALNGQLGVITAISTANNTITVNIDSSSYGAFSWPTSAVAATGVSQALVVPVGEAAQSPYQNLLDDATVNQSFTGVTVGTTVQTSGSTYQWVARKGVSI